MTSTLQQSSPTSADPVLVPRGSMATNFRRPLQIRCLFDTGGGVSATNVGRSHQILRKDFVGEIKRQFADR